MAEQYPSDAALLELEQDPRTGVEYIATGRSPYYLEFRRMLQRLLLCVYRANDFRVYQDGELSVGVRTGRCVIGNQSVTLAQVNTLTVANNATTHLWLDTTGAVRTGTSGLPADRTTHLPLAKVATAAGKIQTITDLRGEGYLVRPDLEYLGVSAAAEAINRALDGANPSVDAQALNVLTAGQQSTADAYHRHLEVRTHADARTAMRLVNASGAADANIALRFEVPAKLSAPADLFPDTATGYLKQHHLNEAYALLGSVHVSRAHEGELTSSRTGRLMGVAPLAGAVSDVVLSMGRNMQSSDSADGVSATVRVNAATVTSTEPAVFSSDGAGFVSTAQGDGVPAVVKSDGSEVVSKGDVLTVDLERTVNGGVSVEPANVVVLVVIRNDGPA